LRYLFVAKNNTNTEDKTSSAKISLKEYYHESKFNWNISKQKKCYARCLWWKEVINGDFSSEAWENIKKKYSWWKEDKKWRFKKYIYKQKTFVKILQRITTKKSELDKKQVIVGFGNWGNPRDSIIRGRRRGPVQEVKNKLQKWCEVVDLDEFRTSKLCYHCVVKWLRLGLMEK
jgi:hypothetical protein